MPRKSTIVDYLAAPFPGTKGFSPYRFPGSIVHVPVLLLFVAVGVRLTWWNLWLYPLFVVYLAAGVYVGRDLAILAHYNPLITLMVISGVLGAVCAPQSVARLWPQSGNWPMAVGTSMALAVFFGLWVWWRTRDPGP